ncbi:MAG: hypothetical protein ACREOC_04185 [Gemmatimonadales bacterium]
MLQHWNEERARNWHLFRPPARPSPAEVARYAAALRDASRTMPWGLLGSTPELRSLAASEGQPLVCIDRDPKVFAALGGLVPVPGVETFVCSDWILAEPPAPLSVVMGDGSINMLPPERHQAFLARAHAMVEPGGLALLRVHVTAPPRFRDPAAVFACWRATDRREPVFTATRTDLDMLWLEPGSLRLNFGDCHARLEQLHRDGMIEPDEFDAYHRLLRFNRIDLWYLTRRRFETLAAPWFDIVRVEHGCDYTGAAQHPVYVLRRRSSP